MKFLEATDPDLLRQAWLDLGKLEELAFDPRAYDFDHPVHKRPNHHFGQWDLHLIDNRGFYRRFVLQQVTLDALLSRAERPSTHPHDELLFEAAAVFAGTMLMGSGTTGDSPDCHDSTVSLGTLLPHIAKYRDAFYEHLDRAVDGPACDAAAAGGGAAEAALWRGAARFERPFGAAPGVAARARASGAGVRANGVPGAAARQAAVVPVASARMMCDMHCRLATTHLELDSAAGRTEATHAVLDQAPQRLTEIQDILHRGIRCGAIVDPWNILGFDAQFSLFHALENSVYDHRIDHLIDVVVRIFNLYVRLISEAAATGHGRVRERLLAELERLGRMVGPIRDGPGERRGQHFGAGGLRLGRASRAGAGRLASRGRGDGRRRFLAGARRGVSIARRRSPAWPKCCWKSRTSWRRWRC